MASSSVTPHQPFYPQLSSFNPSKSSFAAVAPGLGDSDKLRVWSTDTSVLTAEWDIVRQNKAGVTSIVWVKGGLGAEAKGGEEGGRSPKKRRKSLTGPTASGSNGSSGEEEVIYVVSGNVIQVYSPTTPKPIHRITLTSAPQAVCSVPDVGLLLADSASLAVYDLATESIKGTKIDIGLSDRVTALAGVIHEDRLYAFVGSAVIVCATIALTPESSASEPVITPSYTAGIESAQDLVAIVTDAGQITVLAAERDSRVVSAITLKNDRLAPLASLPLPTINPVHSLATGAGGRIFALSTSGEAYGFDLAAMGDVSQTGGEAGAASGKNKKRKTAPIPALKPDVTIRASSAATPIVALGVMNASARSNGDEMDVDGGSGEADSLIVGLGRGVGRVVWETTGLADAAGRLKSEIVIKSSAGKLADMSADVDPGMKRYKEDHVGKAAQQQAIGEDLRSHREDIELPVDGELAEMTLADRLAVLNPANADKVTPRTKETAATADTPAQLSKQNAQSLSRMLLQALHTSDPQLLDLILTSPANSSPAIVRNTIRKLPAAMALPLLKACVERLGQGAGARRRGGGRGGGLNERQGSNVVAWIRGVLVERGAILMTIPSLPVQLASLTHLLENRLQLQTPLLALSGRLDLALEQIELRKSILAARSEVQGGVYIEGESDSEVEIEEGNEEGIVEEIRFASRRGGDAASSDDERPRTKVNGYSRRNGSGPNGPSTGQSDLDEEEESEDESDDAEEGSDAEAVSGSEDEEDLDQD